jgi:hypothetical protein
MVRDGGGLHDGPRRPLTQDPWHADVSPGRPNYNKPNPLDAVETIRMLLAEGKLALKDEVYVPVGDLTSLAVPETLTALIAARLDGLPPEDLVLILGAAVLGQSFTPAALAAVTGTDAATLEPRIQALIKRELLAVVR